MKSAAAYLREIALDQSRVPSFSEYPYGLPVCRNLKTLQFHPAVTFLVGENGSGKSTLLEALAVMLDINPEGGSGNMHFSTRESHSPLHSVLTMVRGVRRPRDRYFLRAESFFNVATEIENLDMIPANSPPIIQSYGGQSLHEQSHGESFFTLVMQRFGGEGLYILDEPEAALSPMRQLALLVRMHELAESGSQFIIATHSPILMAYPDALIYSLSEEGIRRVAYTDTEHYAVTRRFMNDHQAVLNELLNGNK